MNNGNTGGTTLVAGGGTTPIAGGAGLEQAGAGGSQCNGSLDAVNQALAVPCPVMLCDATAWGTASCSSSQGVTKASELFCGELRALTMDLEDGVSTTCIYAATTKLGGSLGTAPTFAEGPLVGAMITSTDNRFCNGMSATISAGQQLPVECANFHPNNLCERTLDTGAGGAPGDDPPAQPVRSCFNLFNGICAPCCPATTPDCSDKPNGFPGYSCTPEGNSVDTAFCSCACRDGEWQCGC